MRTLTARISDRTKASGLLVDPRAAETITDFESVTLEAGPVAAKRESHYDLLPRYLRELRRRGESDAADRIVDALLANEHGD